MRILYHHRTLADGAEGIHIREMVRAFRALGHEVQMLGPVGESSGQPTNKSRRLQRIKRAIPGVIFEFLEVAYSGYAFWKASLAIRRFKPDFLYDRYITFNAGTVLAAKAAGVPILLEVNAPLALERREQKDETLHLKQLAAAMERWICAHASRTIVVSTPLKDYLESIGVPRGQCEVMPNGVDPERFAPMKKATALRDELGIAPSSFVIGFTGVLRGWHGLDMLLTAAAGLVGQGLDIAVVIVGDGPYRADMQQMIEKLGLTKVVHITGLVPHDKVPAYISLFDVAVSPKATFYASPMKVLEYMALGKAVLVPGTQNFLDMIDVRVNGLTFADGDAADMERSLAHLYRSPELCASLGVGAREKIERRLNWRWNAVRSCQLAVEPSPDPALETPYP